MAKRNFNQFKFSRDDLLRKSGIESKFEVIRLAFGRIRQLLREKNKMLQHNPEKLCTRVLREIAEGKLKPESLKEESQEKESPVFTTSPKKEVKAMKGKVKKITDRGFGFIKAEDGKELFFHSSKCKDLFESFKKDDAVTFEIAPSERQPGKMQAVKVRHDSDF